MSVAVEGVRGSDGCPIQSNDSFSAASVSKSFVAAAILHLIQRGSLTPTDSGARTSGLDIPDTITIAQLLRHESGLPEYMGGVLSFQEFLEEHSSGREVWPVHRVRLLAVAGTASETETFSYSNSNYVILGAVIERTTGLALPEALNALVFGPAQLASARLVRTQSDLPSALGYSDKMSEVLGSPSVSGRLTQELLTAGDAARGIAIDVADLARWAHNYFGGRFVGGVVFAPPLGGAAFALSSDRVSVGPGVYQIRYGNQTLRVHGGDGLGTTAVAVYEPETGRSIAIMVNDDKLPSLGFGADGFLDAFALALLSKAEVWNHH